MAALGSHVIVDLFGCDPGLLDDLVRLEAITLDAVKRSGATIKGHEFVTYEPQGVSGVVIVAESHLSIHSWPEHGFLAVDYFTCGNRVVQAAAIDAICEALRPERVVQRHVPRGEGFSSEDVAVGPSGVEHS